MIGASRFTLMFPSYVLNTGCINECYRSYHRCIIDKINSCRIQQYIELNIRSIKDSI